MVIESEIRPSGIGANKSSPGCFGCYLMVTTSPVNVLSCARWSSFCSSQSCSTWTRQLLSHAYVKWRTTANYTLFLRYKIHIYRLSNELDCKRDTRPCRRECCNLSGSYILGPVIGVQHKPRRDPLVFRGVHCGNYKQPVKVSTWRAF